MLRAKPMTNVTPYLMTLAVAEAIVERRAVSWVAYMTGKPTDSYLKMKRG